MVENKKLVEEGNAPGPGYSHQVATSSSVSCLIDDWGATKGIAERTGSTPIHRRALVGGAFLGAILPRLLLCPFLCPNSDYSRAFLSTPGQLDRAGFFS